MVACYPFAWRNSLCSTDRNLEAMQELQREGCWKTYFIKIRKRNVNSNLFLPNPPCIQILQYFWAWLCVGSSFSGLIAGANKQRYLILYTIDWRKFWCSDPLLIFHFTQKFHNGKCVSNSYENWTLKEVSIILNFEVKLTHM